MSAGTARARRISRARGAASARPRRGWRVRPLLIVPALVAVFLYLPIAIVALFSFNSSRSLAVFDGFSLRWYESMLRDGDLWASVALSVQVAALTSVVSLVLGTALALALRRLRGIAAGAPSMLLTLALITPEIVLGFSLLMMFTTLDVALSRWTIAVGHITFSLAFTTLIVRARLAMLRDDLEEAAMDLGATRWQSLRLVVLPQLWPALLGAGMLVFVLSFDDFVISLFTSGVGTSPLPVRIYSMIRFGVTPEINAIATLMMVVTIAIGVASIALTRRR